MCCVVWTVLLVIYYIKLINHHSVFSLTVFFIAHMTHEDEMTTLSRNVKHQSPSDMMSYPIKTESSITSLQKPKNLHCLMIFAVLCSHLLCKVKFRVL